VSAEKFFRALVLQALWLLLLRAFGGNPRTQAAVLRGEMIRYFDEHGNQRGEAREYRRQETFPELPPVK
jgi:hypothetical protein